MNECIRRVRDKDYPQVNKILEEDSKFHVELEPDWMTDTSGISEPEFREWIEAEDKEMLVLEIDEKVVGVLQLRLGEGGDLGMKNRPYGWVDEIAVAESFRNKGLGKKLMDAAENWAKDKNLRMLMLDVWKRNVRAIAVYDKHGYSTFRQRMYKEIE